MIKIEAVDQIENMDNFVTLIMYKSQFDMIESIMKGIASKNTEKTAIAPVYLCLDEIQFKTDFKLNLTKEALGLLIKQYFDMNLKGFEISLSSLDGGTYYSHHTQLMLGSRVSFDVIHGSLQIHKEMEHHWCQCGSLMGEIEENKKIITSGHIHYKKEYQCFTCKQIYEIV